MTNRLLRHRPSPGTVLGTIAVFIALGGGYATAFTGSGSLQKAALDPVSTSFEDARSIKGFGMLEARCDGAETEVEYRFDNTGSNAFIIEATQDGTYQNHDSIGPGEQSDPYETGGSGATVKFYLWRNQDGAKAQADVTAHHTGPFLACASDGAKARILVLNTQQ